MLANRICTVPLSVLQASPYFLVMDESVQVKVISTNFYGDSPISEAGNGALIWVVPDAPINLQNDADTTDAFNIRFTWTEGIENGGTEVLDFIVYYDQGTDSYVELESGIIDSSYTTSVTLTPDVNYSFKVQARNAVGRGAISESIMIKAARVPDAPINLANVPEITTAYKIGLTWEPGLYDGGSAVLDYRLSVNMHSADSFTVYRDDITETALTILGLEPGVTYTFKIESRNLVGYSDYSNTVAILAAQIPDPPI